MKQTNPNKGISFLIAVGSYGGFYAYKSKTSIRLCLGWIAFTLFPFDLEDVLTELKANHPSGE